MMPEARQTLYKLGLASLSASQKDLEQLASAYWYTFEMGLCQDNGRSIVGGAVMSSKQETSNAMSASAKIIDVFHPFLTFIKLFNLDNVVRSRRLF